MENNNVGFFCPDEEYCVKVRACNEFERYVYANGKMTERVLCLFFGFDDGQNLSIEDVARKMRLERERVVEILEAAEKVYSDILAKNQVEERKKQIKQYISWITEEEEKILYCLKGAEDGVEKSPAEVASYLGITIENVNDVIEAISFRREVGKKVHESDDGLFKRITRSMIRQLYKEIVYLFMFGYGDIGPGEGNKIDERYSLPEGTTESIYCRYRGRRICSLVRTRRLKDFLD